MKIFLAGNTFTSYRERQVLTYCRSRLRSYYFPNKDEKQKMRMLDLYRSRVKRDTNRRFIELFLDSGAYSAYTKGVKIELDEYIQFIKDHKDIIHVYANLDSIGDAKQTLKNQRYMESKGLHPLPTFHMNEDFKYLKFYINRYDYIALGGMANCKNKHLLANWLDHCWNLICDEDGMPKVKVHGFALTRLDIMTRYPWYSVDSTSWVAKSRFGSILIPRMKNGKISYEVTPVTLFISSRSPENKQEGKHYNNITSSYKKYVDEYIKSLRLPLGRSSYKKVPEGYKLNNERKGIYLKERFYNKERTIVEVIEEPGLINAYVYRDKANVIFFRRLEETFRKWPWPYKRSKRKSILL